MRHLCTHQTHIAHYLQVYIDNLFSAVRQHHSLEASLVSAQCVRDTSDLVKASQVIFGAPVSLLHPTPTSPGNTNKISLDCTDSDVTRILPGVLVHRLTTRSSVNGVMGSLIRTAARSAHANVTEDHRVMLSSAPQQPVAVHKVLAEILREV